MTAHQQGGLNDEVIGAILGVEVDQDKVGIIERGGAAHPGVVIDAAEVDEIEQAGAVLGKDIADGGLIMIRVNLLGAQPGRES